MLKGSDELIGKPVYFHSKVGILKKVGNYYVDVDYNNQTLTLLKHKVQLKEEVDNIVQEACEKINNKINEIWNPVFEAFGCEKPIATPIDKDTVKII